ncbi:hypothetical protein ACQB60_27990 [Actinomycetota bacterium Odt1-20B]
MTDVTDAAAPHVYSPISELNLLKEFADSEAAAGCFAEGFEFCPYDWADAGLAQWLCLDRTEEHPFLDRLVPFAMASGSGAMYVLWRCDDREDLATLPVVRFDDEGDLDVVARGLRELFQLLALDSESYLTESEYEFYEEEAMEHAPGHAAYLDWLEGHFGLTAPEVPDDLMERADEEHGARFLRWLIPHAPDDMAESLRKDLSAYE